MSQDWDMLQLCSAILLNPKEVVNKNPVWIAGNLAGCSSLLTLGRQGLARQVPFLEQELFKEGKGDEEI